MPTGWRPADVIEKYPIKKINDVYDFEKYDPKSSKTLQAWAFAQLMFLLFFISIFFSNLALIGNPGIFYFGFFIFTFIYAFTELMDRNPRAYFWELLKFSFVAYCIYQSDLILGKLVLSTTWKIVVLVYHLLSLVATIFFCRAHSMEDQKNVAVKASI